MGPSEEESRIVGEWLDKVEFKCPGCRRNDAFSLGGTIAAPNVSASIALEAPTVATFVTLKCKHCAFVSLLDPAVMKVPQG